MKIEIKNRWDNKILLCGEYESIKDCLEKNRDANLMGADLWSADLEGADVTGTIFEKKEDDTSLSQRVKELEEEVKKLKAPLDT